MIKRSLLASSIAMAFVSQAATAAPLAPIDARGMGMGGTGVASAKLAHAPQYNPALLSTAHEDDDFALIFPQFGVGVADEDEFVDTIEGLIDEDYKTFDESLIDHFSTVAEGLSGSLDNLTNSIEALDTAVQTGNSNNISTATTDLQNQLDSFSQNTSDLESTTFDLTSELDKLSGSGLRVNAGVNAAIAIPSKTFAAALSIGGQVFASGRTIFTPEDQNLINAYAQGVNEYTGLTQAHVANTAELARVIDLPNSPEKPAQVVAATQAVVDSQAALDSYVKNADGTTGDNGSNADNIITVNNGAVSVDEDPELTSQAQVVAIAIAELGLTLSREFDIAGYPIAIGITPKLQQIKAFDYTGSVEDDESIDEEDVKDTEVSFSTINLDAGAAYQFGDSKQWQVGIVAKNLVSKEYETENNLGLNTTINIDTQFRGAISHTTEWTVLAFDLDLAENDPVAFEAPTQYASIGAEFDLFDTFQIRTGYRTNLSDSDSSVASLGFGLSPFGIHLDLAAMTNLSDPKKESAVAFEMGFYF